jgi:DNA gyrase subunit B
VLKGLEAVRKRPGMYIGSTGPRGLHHLVYEVVDNSIDEALAGYADRVAVRILPDNSIMVEDNGRGIPVDVHPVEKLPGLELAMTVLHAGGKFDKNSYKVSGGLHGVGVSCVNALSDSLKVWVKRDGREYYMDFVRGDTKTKLKTLREVPKKETGTKVWFHPDPEIFTESTIYDYGTLQARLQELSFLNKGVTITLKDERPGEEREETFHAEGGLREMVSHLTAEGEQEAAARAGGLHRDRARRHRHRAGDAVQRQLRRERVLVREQHQHARGRHAPDRASRAR